MKKKTVEIFVQESPESCKYHMKGHFLIQLGNIQISSSRTGKPDIIHIRTGRADSLEGGDFKVSELEKAIQDFFDKNF